VAANVEGDVTNNAADNSAGAASMQPGTMFAMNSDENNDIVADSVHPGHLFAMNGAKDNGDKAAGVQPGALSISATRGARTTATRLPVSRRTVTKEKNSALFKIAQTFWKHYASYSVLIACYFSK
jgi:hypothetical protein